MPRTLTAVAALVLAASPVRAQRGWDLQGHAIAMVRDSAFLGGGLGGGLRLGRGLRGALAASIGGRTSGGGVAGRGEAVLTFHVSQPRPGGVGGYVGGGIAGETGGDGPRGLLVALLGLEARPWSGGGWFAELGVGGGVRLVVGYRSIRLARRR